MNKNERMDKMTEGIRIADLFDLEQTIAAEVFSDCEYPWEALPKIKDFIIKLGETLPESEYFHPAENIWISRTAEVFPSAYIKGPCIICNNAEIRHCAFIRGCAIVGENAVVGNSTELKNVILFNRVQVPHYNYVGDSVLGYRSHMGAGAITSKCQVGQNTRDGPRRRSKDKYLNEKGGYDARG
jgi:NDP-sugar pyrophosphorylase family protein